MYKYKNKLTVKPIESDAKKYSSLTTSWNYAGKSMAIARNAIDGISRYGEIAKSKAIRSTAKWMNANVRRLKAQMKQQFNTP